VGREAGLGLVEEGQRCVVDGPEEEAVEDEQGALAIGQLARRELVVDPARAEGEHELAHGAADALERDAAQTGQDGSQGLEQLVAQPLPLDEHAAKP
jgi:hypothetical protein